MEKYNNFGALEESFIDPDTSEIAVLSVPYDETSTWIKGADKGPLAIIKASSALEVYDIETDSEVYKKGIYTCPAIKTNASPEDMSGEVENKVSGLINAGKFVVILGGEHSVSIGAIKAHNSKFKDLSVLQFDAHADLRDEYEGSKYNHACVMARVKEIAPFVQVGIRSMSVEEKDKLDASSTFFAKDINGGDIWINKVVEKLTSNVYVSIDLDVFDPSIMPSTGTPEPGGLTWYQVLRLLKAVSESKNVVGFDVVELCPMENNSAPDFAAAKLIYKFLSYIYENRSKK